MVLNDKWQKLMATIMPKRLEPLVRHHSICLLLEYIEASSKTGENVKDVFTAIVEKLSSVAPKSRTKYELHTLHSNSTSIQWYHWRFQISIARRKEGWLLLTLFVFLPHFVQIQ